MKNHYFQKGKDVLVKHLVDTTALNSFANPIFSVFESYSVGDEISLNARILASLTGYLGIGSLLSRGRDLSKKVFKITEGTSRKMQSVHDALYLGTFNLAINPLFYYVCGARDMKDIALGTAGGVAFGLLAGSPIGYTIDSARDLAGIEKSERLPNLIGDVSEKIKEIQKKYFHPSLEKTTNYISKKLENTSNCLKFMKPQAKKYLAGALVAGSIAVMPLIYAVTPDKEKIQEIPQVTIEFLQENVLENSLEGIIKDNIYSSTAPKTLESGFSE